MLIYIRAIKVQFVLNFDISNGNELTLLIVQQKKKKTNKFSHLFLKTKEYLLSPIDYLYHLIDSNKARYAMDWVTFKNVLLN